MSVADTGAASIIASNGVLAVPHNSKGQEIDDDYDIPS